MAVKKITGVYCIENTVNHKKYISQSLDIKERWRKHRKKLYANKHYNSHLQEDWNNYGKSSFSFYILEECSAEMLDEKEVYYIDFFHSLNRNYGYNLKTGGQCIGVKVLDEVRNNISSAVKNSYTDELKEKRRQDATNYWADPDNLKKITGENNGMYGKHHSVETRNKISKKKQGVPCIFRNRTPVLCIESQQEYNDATDAGKALGIDGSAILKVCQGKRHTCGGYHWKFINN